MAGGPRDELVWCTTATGWSKSARNVFVAPWLCGAAALLHEGRFDPLERLELIEREGVNVLCQAPTEYRMLAKRAEIRPIASMRRMVSAGEPLNPGVIDAFRERVGLEICDGYGQTETGQVSGNLVGDEVRSGSMGRPLPGIEVRIVDGELQVGTAYLPDLLQPLSGQRAVRGRLVADRRRGQPRRRRVPVVRGPRDDLILSSGYRIGPFEVESALLTHPSVAEAAAVAAPDPERGSVVRAIVVLRDGEPGDGAGPRAPGALQAGHRPVQVPPHRRVRRSPAEDDQRKDQAGRASRRRDPLSADATLPLRGLRGHLRRHPALADGRRGSVAGAAPIRRGPLDSGNIAVGVVVGCYALTGLAGRPIAGRWADHRGRKPVVVLGTLLAALAGLLYLLPTGLPGLIGARLVLGLGEGSVFTAGSAWIVDLAPPGRRGRVIGLYGLAVWSGLSIGPSIGELLYHAGGFDLVWAFAAAAPFLGALVALRIRDPFQPSRQAIRGPLIARESIRPGFALSLASVGYAAMASFIVLHCRQTAIRTGRSRSPCSPPPWCSPGCSPEIFPTGSARFVARRAPPRLNRSASP